MSDEEINFNNIKTITQVIAEKKAAESEFNFRGTHFKKTGGCVSLQDLSSLYLVYRAIEGDELAADLLYAAGTVVKDAAGLQVWPIVARPYPND